MEANRTRKQASRGALDLLILKALSTGSLHGVGVAQRIGQITGGAISVSYGSLFPALHRMEARGWLDSEWDVSEANRRAKFYQLTRSGRKQLRAEEREWERVARAVFSALRS